MDCIAFGIDASKGRADIEVYNQSGTRLSGSCGYDDTRAGHDRLSEVLRDLRRQYPEAKLIAGVEATGGYERNWVAFFRREQGQGRSVAIHRLNPLGLKRFLDADLHRKVDDQRAAAGIARYLLERKRQAEPDAIPLDGRVVFYRNIRGLINGRTALVQRFKALLSSTNPEMVQYCHDELPRWVLLVTAKYPTAAHLVRSHGQALADLPHVGASRAEQLRMAAKTSVAALTDDGSAAAMRLLTDEILHLNDRIEALKAQLITMTQDDPQVKLLDSIPGIAPWTAAALALEIGDITRFADVRQLVAWSGLDPREDISGDGTIKRGISHRGNAHLRTLLVQMARTARLHNPVIAGFIKRKVGEGKKPMVALVAGAAKLLRIAFAMLASGKPFDHEHEAKRAKSAAEERQKQRTQTVAPPKETTPPDLAAPVSATEARKRRRATPSKATATKRPECEVMPQDGSPATVAPAASQQLH
jgi:transposase